MQVKPTRRSNLFLLELIFAILFFSLAAAVCVRFFVKSHTLENESRDLNHAVSSVSSAAEILRNQEDPYKCLETQFPQGEYNGSDYLIYYNEDWELCSASDAAYTMEVQTNIDSSSILNGNIQLSKGDTSLYMLTVKKYIREGVHFQ